MSAPDSSYVSGMAEQRSKTKPRSAASVVIAICCLAVILALVLGVGLASNLVLRHFVQTLPLWIGVVLGFRHSRSTGWAALPPFLIWLTIMALIWAYLLGVSHLVSGHFSPVEIAMTGIVGLASIAGIGGFVRSKSHLSPVGAGVLFVIMAIVQWICLRASQLPSIAHR